MNGTQPLEPRDFDIVFLAPPAIGNVIELLYSVEYCLSRGVRAGIFAPGLSPSFAQYLTDCYGPETVLNSIAATSTRHLVHHFVGPRPEEISYKYYFYLCPDATSCSCRSETEMGLDIVKALFPSDPNPEALLHLREREPDNAKVNHPENLYAIYPGCGSKNTNRRWPHYRELMRVLGEEQCIVLGGAEDLDYRDSFVYPRWVSKVVPQQVLNRRPFWKSCKRLGLLRSHAHFLGIEKRNLSFFDVFSWAEMVYLFRRCKGFVGNDGGIMHLAAAAGAKGVAIFGPTAVAKNRPLNSRVASLSLAYDCEPCQFCVNGKIAMSWGFSNCPYELRCLQDLSVEQVVSCVTKWT